MYVLNLKPKPVWAELKKENGRMTNRDLETEEELNNYFASVFTTKEPSAI